MAKRLGAWFWVASLLATGCGRYGYDLLSRNDAQVGNGSGDGGLPDASQTSSDGGDGDGDGDGDGAAGDAAVPGDGDGDGDGDGGSGPLGDAAVRASSCPAPVDADAAGPKHRYELARTDTLVEDSVSLRHGSATGATQGGGTVTLGGSAGSHVQLPSGLVSAMDAATVMLWVRWDSGPQSQTVFDFGQSAGNRLWLLASSPGQGLTLGLETGTSSLALASFTPLSIGVFQQIAVELDPAAGRVALYKNGVELVARTGVSFSLSALRDDNTWLGRSNGSDQPFSGAYEEVRLYDRALGPCAIAQASNSGAASTRFARCADPDDNCDYVTGAGGDFWMCDSSRAFTDAAARCADAGMRLVSVNDGSRDQALLEAANGSALYLGLHDPEGTGEHRWCDGLTPSYSSLPAGGAAAGEDCVVLEATGTWRSVQCTNGYPYACEP